MSSPGSYLPTPVQSGLADVDQLAAWLENNEHQALDLLMFTLKDYGYAKSRVQAAYIVYIDKRTWRT